MQLSEFAKTILLSSDITDKLATPETKFKDDGLKISLPRGFTVPARQNHLKLTSGREINEKFPKNFEVDSSRGIALHSFANHELLALELMALCLIKFPDADPAFRKGLYYTMLEEQQHCKLYIKRMNELGVGLGDVAVNSFFWDVMNEMKTPLEFITKMSLVFEQANLDYSLYYFNLFKKIEDKVTAEIMKQVYEDEIGHVAHGIKWFNEWDESGKEMYDSHVENLDFPLSLKWAKGLEFDEEGRRRAGFSDSYIENIRVFQKSRGSVPNLYFFNPDCEESYNRPAANKQNRYIETFRNNLDFVTCFLAKSHDVCILSKRPSNEHLKFWVSKGLKLPEIVESPNPHSAIQDLCKNRKIDSVVPWGAASEIEAENSPLSFSSRENLFSKAMHLTFIKSLESKIKSNLLESYEDRVVIDNYPDFEKSSSELLSNNQNIVLKNEFGSSGRGNLKLNSDDIARDNIIQGIKNSFEKNEPLVLESWKKRICDFSFVGDLSNTNRKKSVNLLRPVVDHLGQYRGHLIGGYPMAGLPEEVKKYLYSEEASFSYLLEEIKNEVETYLSRKSYKGPYGVDLFLYENSNRDIKLQISEINVRHTMGHVAEKLEKTLGIKPPHLWMTLPKKVINKDVLNDLMNYKNTDKYFSLSETREDTGVVSIVYKGAKFEQLWASLKESVVSSKSKFLDEIDLMLKSYRV